MKGRLLMLAAVLLPFGALAEDAAEWRTWPTGERFRVGASVFFPSLDTRVAASDRQGLVGTEIEFERDLGLSDSKSTFLAVAKWRMFKRHTLALNYFSLNRSGSQISGATINFGGEVFSASLPIQAFFDITALEVNYRYSILFDEKKDWYIGVGLALQDLGFGLQGTDAGSPGTIITERVETAAPLPTLRTGFTYALAENWLIGIDVGYLAVELDLDDNEKFDGSVWNSSIGIRWQAFNNVAFDLAYSDFRVDVEYEKRDLLGEVDYKYRGPVLGLSVNF